MVRQALFLQSRGLPVTPDTLNAYLSHLPAGALGGLLESLGDLLKSFRLPGFDRSTLQSLANRIEQTIPQTGELTGDTLKTLLETLGLDLEGRLAAWLAAGNKGLPDGLDNTLKLALLRLQARLENLDLSTLDDSGRNTLQNLQDRLGQTLRFLNTAQAEALPATGREALHLQIPLYFNEQATTADLRLFYHQEKDGSHRLDPGNLRLSLSLNLTGLGLLRIELSVANHHAVCNIRAADDEKTAFFQETADELKTALEKCGYTVSTIACRTLKERDDDGDEHPPSVGLDLRV
ncbi:MAG: flagellar hook-length control protein FliK [bacterium]|nr:flagellar hook-length control protein FliK [bacterium]